MAKTKNGNDPRNPKKEKRLAGKYTYVCGSPRELCTGAPTEVSNGLKLSHVGRSHNSPEAAFQCYRASLVARGGVLNDSRGVSMPVAPDSSERTVHVLTKPSRFGARLRPGKGDRQMPHRRGGVIV